MAKPSESGSSSTPKPDLSAYLARSKDVFNEKRAGGLVVKARRTAEELDRRREIDADSVEGGWRWRGTVDDVGDQEKARLERRERLRKSFLRDDYADVQEELQTARESSKGKGRAGETLDYATGLSTVVVDDINPDEILLEEETEVVDEAEREAWSSQDVRTSLRPSPLPRLAK